PVGIRRLTVPARGGLADLAALMKEMHGLGILHVLCEGGGELAGALLRGNLVDEIVWFSAPTLLGGDARPALAGSGWPIGKQPRLSRIQKAFSGPDLVIRARVEYVEKGSGGRHPTPDARRRLMEPRRLTPTPLSHSSDSCDKVSDPPSRGRYGGQAKFSEP
ncbi:MAG: dihydrofolate reductase family protein, partial [Kiritimatiellia bacterium]|nr:dihydrofolate reductase family protein [Kiritimatiellia bacterium]